MQWIQDLSSRIDQTEGADRDFCLSDSTNAYSFPISREILLRHQRTGSELNSSSLRVVLSVIQFRQLAHLLSRMWQSDIVFPLTPRRELLSPILDLTHQEAREQQTTALPVEPVRSLLRPRTTAEPVSLGFPSSLFPSELDEEEGLELERILAAGPPAWVQARRTELTGERS